LTTMTLKPIEFNILIVRDAWRSAASDRKGWKDSKKH